MWYPSKVQWWFIWIIAILAFFFLVNGGMEVALGLVALGCLLVWQLSRSHKKPENGETEIEEKSGTQDPESAYCVECGARLEISWKHCPYCGSAKF